MGGLYEMKLEITSDTALHTDEAGHLQTLVIKPDKSCATRLFA